MTIPAGNLVSSLNHARVVFDEFVHKASYTGTDLFVMTYTTTEIFLAIQYQLLYFFIFFPEQSGVIQLVYYYMYNAYTETFVFNTFTIAAVYMSWRVWGKTMAWKSD